MAKITYDNKVNVTTNNNIPNINKVTANDMNEIKQVVNSNYDESKDDNFYKTGDVIELGSTNAANEYIVAGYISSGTTTLYLSIITPKRLDNISSITVNNLEVEARGISGYLNSLSGFTEYVGLSGYTITAGKGGTNAITLIVSKSSAFTNTSNNTPVELNGYFKLTLS